MLSGRTLSERALSERSLSERVWSERALAPCLYSLALALAFVLSALVTVATSALESDVLVTLSEQASEKWVLASAVASDASVPQCTVA